jgi:hypothetical protein
VRNIATLMFAATRFSHRARCAFRASRSESRHLHAS